MVDCATHKRPNGHSPNADKWLAAEQPQNLTPSILCLHKKAGPMSQVSLWRAVNLLSLLLPRFSGVVPLQFFRATLPQPSIHFLDSPAGAGPTYESIILQRYFRCLRAHSVECWGASA